MEFHIWYATSSKSDISVSAVQFSKYFPIRCTRTSEYPATESYDAHVGRTPQHATPAVLGRPCPNFCHPGHVAAVCCQRLRRWNEEAPLRRLKPDLPRYGFLYPGLTSGKSIRTTSSICSGPRHDSYDTKLRFILSNSALGGTV